MAPKKCSGSVYLGLFGVFDQLRVKTEFILNLVYHIYQLKLVTVSPVQVLVFGFGISFHP
jgi:hypothetical protein